MAYNQLGKGGPVLPSPKKTADSNMAVVKSRPYKYQEWPRMFYHPTKSDVYRACATKEEVPEGYVTEPGFVGKTDDEVKKILDDRSIELGSEEPEALEALEALEAPEAPEAPEALEALDTFEDIGVGRKEALAVLKEEGVTVAKNASEKVVCKLLREALNKDGNGG